MRFQRDMANAPDEFLWFHCSLSQYSTLITAELSKALPISPGRQRYKRGLKLNDQHVINVGDTLCIQVLQNSCFKYLTAYEILEYRISEASILCGIRHKKVAQMQVPNIHTRYSIPPIFARDTRRRHERTLDLYELDSSDAIPGLIVSYY